MQNIATTSNLDSLNKEDIFSFWPMEKSQPRKSQIEVMEWIKTLPSHIKYILCEVPVGGGKSSIGLNASGWFSKQFGNSYILTPQKILQKQYEDTFNNRLLHSLYGKANYKCESHNTNCEIGSKLKKCTNCTHQREFKACAHSPNVVLNYTLAFLLFKYVVDDKIISKRNLIVFDECHTIENHLTEFNAVSISEARCKQVQTVAFKQHNTLKSAVEWTKDVYVPALTARIKKIGTEVQEILDTCIQDDRGPRKDEMEIIQSHEDLSRHYDMIIEQIVMPDFSHIYENYVLVNEGKTLFKFKELYGRRNFKSIVEPMADKFLFMSSTILNKEEFCSDLGLDPNQAAFISLNSEFDVDNRPIIYMPTCKMNYGWDSPDRKKEVDLLIDRISNICNTIHSNESGIIHAGSFQIASYLVDALQGKIPHVIMHHNPGSGLKRDAVIDEFQEDDGIPKILISPSITEGLDLKDDKGRFAIFAKVPFPFLGDAWVKKRMDLSDAWYKRQALISIIQGGGRVVRSAQDWGHVYILDSSLTFLLNTSKNMIPKWWSESFIKTEK